MKIYKFTRSWNGDFTLLDLGFDGITEQTEEFNYILEENQKFSCFGFIRADSLGKAKKRINNLCK